MTPQDQEVFEPWQHGDCARAVIASLLDLPIAEVPNFAALATEGNGFWNMTYDWLEARGLEFLPQVSLVYYWRPGDPDLYHYMMGPSPRGEGIYHAVVGLNGVPYFDPHPSRAMLAGEPSQWQISIVRKAK
jgi:hypothetical protein